MAIKLPTKAGEPGFEPRYPGPKPGVLPLDDSPALFRIYLNTTFFKKLLPVRLFKNLSLFLASLIESNSSV